MLHLQFRVGVSNNNWSTQIYENDQVCEHPELVNLDIHFSSAQ